LKDIHIAFEDYHVAMPLVISEDDTVAVRMVMTGTHTGIFKGIPPNGRHVQWEIMVVMRIKDGLIWEQESFRDWAELINQLQWPRVS
jgi:predicted ester cyclase